MLVGMALGLVSFSSSGVAVGYSGAGLNPGRCFAFAIARRDLKYNWIWWVGPGVGGLLLALMYNLVPPYHTTKMDGSREDDESKLAKPGIQKS
jgi:glycerol uptake facilitator-like aquaporin